MRQTKTQRTDYRLFFALTAVALLLLGCASGSHWSWRHPDGLGSAELQQAEIDCRELAENELDRFDYFRRDYGYPYYYDRHAHYGHLRPFPPLHSSYDFHRYNLDYTRLYRFCLQSKGWQRIKLDPSRQPVSE